MENKSILFLRGEVGTGKTTLLKKHLGAVMHKAGGFVTRQIMIDGRMHGIEILPAREYLSESCDDKTFICTFKDGVPCFNPEPLREYFESRDTAPFYLFDEIGGIELLDPEFKEDFRRVMAKGKPLIAVLKSAKKSFLLSRKLGMEPEYKRAYAEFEEMIKSFPQAEILEHSGIGDVISEKALCSFIKEKLDAQFV